jgi:hypothetical protein
MTARAQAAGIKPVAYAVVVNIKGKGSFTIGPFRNEKKASEVALSKDANSPEGWSAWVDPIYAEADAQRIRELEARD